MRSVLKSRPAQKPASASKSGKAFLARERLQELIAERSGERPERITIFGEPGNWDAALLVKVGNAERKARVRSIVSELRSEFDLQD